MSQIQWKNKNNIFFFTDFFVYVSNEFQLKNVNWTEFIATFWNQSIDAIIKKIRLNGT